MNEYHQAIEEVAQYIRDLPDDACPHFMLEILQALFPPQPLP